MQNYNDAYQKIMGVGETHPWISRWCGISIASMALGNRVWLQHGHERVFPNLYIFVIGEPAARKSTAIRLANKALVSVGGVDFAPSTVTKTQLQKFLCSGDYNFEGSEPEAGRNCAILHDEIANFFGDFGKPLSSILTEVYDQPAFLHYGKAASLCPALTLLGGITPQSLLRTFPPDIIGQGFFSRVLFIYAPNPESYVASPIAGSMVGFLPILKKLTSFSGELTLSDRAKEIFSDVYLAQISVTDSRFHSYNARRHTHLLKLAIISAITRGSRTIEEKDAIFCNSLLWAAESVMPRAIGSFGRSKSAEIEHIVWQTLVSNKLPMSQAELHGKVSSELNTSSAFSDLLGRMILSKRVKIVNGGKIMAIQARQEALPVHFSSEHLQDAKWILQ